MFRINNLEFNMKKKLIKYTLFITSISFFCFLGINFAQQSIPDFVNTSHLDHLFQKINVNGREMGFLYFNSTYPDYKYADNPGVGIANVSDASQGIIFYIKYYEHKKDSSIINKIKMLTNFLLYMQDDNGFFNNYIWENYSKDISNQMSIAAPNMWSWKAIFALGEAYNFFKKEDPEYSERILKPLQISVSNTRKWLIKNKSDSTQNFGGFRLPTWLPNNTNADQAAMIVKGFLSYYSATHDTLIKLQIIHLCGGIKGMQAGTGREFPYYGYLTNMNNWQQDDQYQAEAMLNAGKLFNISDYISSAQKEIWDFYPYLIKGGYLYKTSVNLLPDTSVLIDSVKYPQLPSGILPFVSASVIAYNYAKDMGSASVAGLLANWFLGQNAAGMSLYNYKTGICFNKIVNETDIDKNSGAQATINALQTFLEIDKVPLAKRIVWNYIQNHPSN